MGGDGKAAQLGFGLSLIKQLWFGDERSRDKALRILLESWLPSQPNLTEEIMEKLWKGLFFCVWDADFQSRGLIDRLASVLPRLHNSSLSLHYFSSFLITMRREWPDNDVLRLEKFYLLNRRFLHHSFAFLKIHSWDLEITSRLISLLKDTCFLVKQGNLGISYHIASVFLEELRPFLPLRREVLEVVFKPFISVLGSLPDEVLFGKIKSNMFDVLLKMGSKLLEVNKLGDGNEVHDNDDAMVLGTIALTMGFSNKFSELASSVECCQGNMNRNLLVLYKQFLKLEKDLESSGNQVSVSLGIERVPTLKKNKKKASGGNGGKKDKKKKNVAAEAGLDNDVVEDLAKKRKRSNCELPKTKVNGKKKKRAKTINGQNPELDAEKIGVNTSGVIFTDNDISLMIRQAAIDMAYAMYDKNSNGQNPVLDAKKIEKNTYTNAEVDLTMRLSAIDMAYVKRGMDMYD